MGNSSVQGGTKVGIVANPAAGRDIRRLVAQALLDHLPELHEVQEVAPDAAPATTIIPVSSIGFGKPGSRG